MKKIILIADSATDLMPLAHRLKKNFQIIWLTYHKNVFKDLKKLNFKKIYFCDIKKEKKILFINNKFINKIHNKFLSLMNINKIDGFLEKLSFIEKEENPFCFVTDTFNLLKYYKTKKLKMSFGHSVPYKKFFLIESNLKYDYLFLPGYYHYNKAIKLYSSKIKQKLKVFGSIKLTSFLNTKSDKKKFNKKNKLKYTTNVLFAPSHDAHAMPNKNRFFPNNFGNQIEKLEKLIILLDDLKANLIIKLHHYHSNYLPEKIFKKYNNVKIFKSGNFFDIKESSEFILNSDVIISDTSGVATSGIYLDKKMIFIEPTSKKWNWFDADIKKNLRPGYICYSFDDLKKSLFKSLKEKDIFKNSRNKFVKTIFYKPNNDATIEISKFIKSIK